jgi:hypothetical protein
VSAAALAVPVSPLSGGALQLIRASTNDELHAAAAFRRSIFFERRGVSFDEVLEARRDRAGHVLLLLAGGQPVATARILRYPTHLSTLHEMAPALDADADSEVGRIAALASPEGIRHSRALLALGAAWLIAHTDLRRYVAYCHPKLLALYRQAGAGVVGVPCPVPGRADPYLVIAGRYEDAAASVRPGAGGTI